jgi:hypothetical protein
MHKRRHGRVRAQGVAGHLRVGATLTPGATIDNLSMGGAFVRTHEVLAVGTAVAVDLVRPGLKKALRLGGRVVSALSAEEAREARAVPGMGIQFDPLDQELKGRMTELLKALAPGEALLDGDRPEKVEAPAAPQWEPPRAPPPQLFPAICEGAVAVPESAKLMVQVTGLLMELGDSQTRTSELERENEELRAEVERLREQLARFK